MTALQVATEELKSTIESVREKARSKDLLREDSQKKVQKHIVTYGCKRS